MLLEAVIGPELEKAPIEWTFMAFPSSLRQERTRTL
jgi:hypothetical protein